MKFETLGFKPDKSRLLTTLKGKELDKVPFFDNYIDSILVEIILGYNAENTYAAVGDPYRGDEGTEVGGDLCIPMDPKDYIKLSNIICQDSIMVEAAYAPYSR